MYDNQVFDDILITLFNRKNMSKITVVKVTPVIMWECLVMDSSGNREALLPSEKVPCIWSNSVEVSCADDYCDKGKDCWLVLSDNSSIIPGASSRIRNNVDNFPWFPSGKSLRNMP